MDEKGWKTLRLASSRHCDTYRRIGSGVGRMSANLLGFSRNRSRFAMPDRQGAVKSIKGHGQWHLLI